jgi:hypothetical protein
LYRYAVVSTAAIGNPIGSDTTLFMGREGEGAGEQKRTGI